MLIPFPFNLIVKAAVGVIERWAIPVLAASHPAIASLLTEVLDVIAGNPPSLKLLQTAQNHATS